MEKDNRFNKYDTIILASRSPRRLEILRANGIDPVVMPTDTNELLPDGIGYREAVEMLSAEKGEACLDMLGSEKTENYAVTGATCSPALQDVGRALIIAADTVVYTESLGIMGKPLDRDDAYAMLDAIRGTSHMVATGVTLIDISGRSKTTKTFSEVTTVWCRDYSVDDIYDYIEREQPYDKAGSYAIQSSFSEHIDHIDGDYWNVVGLPFDRIVSEL